jgi:2-haloacid dehalogenase
MSAPALAAKIKVCMFDQYGTVVDMQKGLTEVVTPYLKDKGWKGRPDAFVTWWRRTHFENSMIDALLDREHTSYREIGHRAVDYTLTRAEHPAHDGRGALPRGADRAAAALFPTCPRRSRA